jgi:hypothetical protein
LYKSKDIVAARAGFEIVGVFGGRRHPEVQKDFGARREAQDIPRHPMRFGERSGGKIDGRERGKCGRRSLCMLKKRTVDHTG